MKKKVLFFLLILLLPTISYALNCSEADMPTFLIEEEQTLYEGQKYEAQIADTPQLERNELFVQQLRGDWLTYDANTGEISQTPSQEDVGINKVIFGLVGSDDCYATKQVTFSVYDKPKIISKNPTNPNVELIGNIKEVFEIIIEDSDDDTHQKTWFLNNERTNKNTTKYILDTNILETGRYELRVDVIDSKGLRDSYVWNIQAEITASTKKVVDSSNQNTRKEETKKSFWFSSSLTLIIGVIIILFTFFLVRSATKLNIAHLVTISKLLGRPSRHYFLQRQTSLKKLYDSLGTLKHADESSLEMLKQKAFTILNDFLKAGFNINYGIYKEDALSKIRELGIHYPARQMVLYLFMIVKRLKEGHYLTPAEINDEIDRAYLCAYELGRYSEQRRNLLNISKP
ncbi:hypothetical protein GOV05_00595 [Candidatus Woesearchaeota archaeon]|nr:hypothetical protein [Candidatus Woesearchaeota archaeon]